MDPKRLYQAVLEAADLLADSARDRRYSTEIGMDDQWDSLLETMTEFSLFDRDGILRATELQVDRCIATTWMAANLQKALIWHSTKYLCPLPVRCEITRTIDQYEADSPFHVTLYVNHPMRRILYQNTNSRNGLLCNPHGPDDILELASVLTGCWDASEYAIGYKAARDEARRQMEERGAKVEK